MMGLSKVASLASHCAACLALRQPALCALVKASPHCLKAMALAALSRGQCAHGEAGATPWRALQVNVTAYTN